MPYTIRESCPRCGRTYTYRSGEKSPGCPLCWGMPDLTDEEAALENSYTAGDD